MRYDPFYPESKEEIQAIADYRKFIPKELFTQIREWSHMPTADFIPTRYGPRGYEFLLAKRREAPWAGQWFFAGGRILPGEVSQEAMVRGCVRELGFTPEGVNSKFILEQSIYNPECAHGGKGYFTQSFCWQVWVEADVKISLDSTQSEYRWFTPEELHDFVHSVYVLKAVAHLHREPARDYASAMMC